MVTSNSYVQADHLLLRQRAARRRPGLISGATLRAAALLGAAGYVRAADQDTEGDSEQLAQARTAAPRPQPSAQAAAEALFSWSKGVTGYSKSGFVASMLRIRGYNQLDGDNCVEVSWYTGTTLTAHRCISARAGGRGHRSFAALRWANSGVDLQCRAGNSAQ